MPWYDVTAYWTQTASKVLWAADNDCAQTRGQDELEEEDGTYVCDSFDVPTPDSCPSPRADEAALVAIVSNPHCSEDTFLTALNGNNPEVAWTILKNPSANEAVLLAIVGMSCYEFDEIDTAIGEHANCTDNIADRMMHENRFHKVH